VKHTLLPAAACLAALAFAACGGSGSTARTANVNTPSTVATAPSRPAGSTASASSSSSTAPPAVTPATGSAAASVTASDAGTPLPAATPSAAEATLTAGLDGEITGGDSSEPPHVVSTVPPPPPGTTPAVDPTNVAPPQPAGDQLEFLVDVDASTPGIQSSRDIKPGDVFRVAVVLANAPSDDDGRIAAFNFTLAYDKTKIVAPSISGGASTARNPAPNLDALGGADGWLCLPAPEGDLDDPGGIEGDGDPVTGQAFLSCFTTGANGGTGTIVLATVEFQAVAAGTSDLRLGDVTVGNTTLELAHCEGDGATPAVPCVAGSVAVQ
jgi:hypothetical protein